MPVIFSDPVGWSASAVATPLRYWFMVTTLVLFQFFLVYVAVTEGWLPALGLAAFLASFQFLFLLALRRLYFKLGAPRVPKGGA